jgi:isopenicillin-N epimerase
VRTDGFLLNPDITFLNHGSFGACPEPVFAVYQQLQRDMERQPVEWLGRRSDELLASARARLAAFLGAQADDLVYEPNPTTAVNIVARSLDLQPGDEVLTTDHEYGAMNRTWRVICEQSQARYVNAPIPVPVSTHADFVERFWQHVTPRTKVIFLSHLTSETALVFPAEEICRRARAAGILTIIDGAHVPAHIPLHLDSLGADFYTGACHKWLCAPKGSAFLWARRDVQPMLRPLVVSWGWEPAEPGPSPFIDHHQWQGTRDLSAFLATPAAIDHQAANDWDGVRQCCHASAVEASALLHGVTGCEPLSPEHTGDDRSPIWYGQMVAIRLPDHVDVAELKHRLYDDHHIEVPVYRWNGIPVLRVSIQVYNTPDDVDHLAAALRALL